MSVLSDIAKRHVDAMMEDLTGDEDFMPFLTIRMHDDGIAYVGMAMPDGDEARNWLADVMMALCAVHRAKEALFVSVSWMVKRDTATISDDESPEYPKVMPRDHPDRIEAVVMTGIAGERRDGSMYSAPVIRENNTVKLGEWDDASGVGIAGRFGDAIINGMNFGAKFPPEMCEYVDAEIAAGRNQELVASMLRAMNSARTGAFNN